MEETLENHKNRQRIELFFESLSKTGNINLSARAAKLGNGSIYNYKEKYEWFRNKMLESMSMFGDKLEGDAFNLIKKQTNQQINNYGFHKSINAIEQAKFIHQLIEIKNTRDRKLLYIKFI